MDYFVTKTEKLYCIKFEVNSTKVPPQTCRMGCSAPVPLYLVLQVRYKNHSVFQQCHYRLKVIIASCKTFGCLARLILFYFIQISINLRLAQIRYFKNKPCIYIYIFLSNRTVIPACFKLKTSENCDTILS
jgi:hypothetical protein